MERNRDKWREMERKRAKKSDRGKNIKKDKKILKETKREKEKRKEEKKKRKKRYNNDNTSHFVNMTCEICPARNESSHRHIASTIYFLSH
jgi:hypothetical protein